MIYRLILFWIVILVALSCKNALTIKPTKYTRHGEVLSCDGYYCDGIIQKVICFSPTRDTVLVESYKDGLRDGRFVLRYNTGEVKETGTFDHGSQVGKWMEYYMNGVTKSFRVFEIENDSSYMIYEKNFDINGTLTALRYPLKFRTNNEEEIYHVGKKYQLFVDLLYSEFDSLHSYGIINDSPDSSVNPDTVRFEGNSLFVEFVPKSKGKHSIDGVYMEFNGAEVDLDKAYGGEKYWKFIYEAK